MIQFPLQPPGHVVQEVAPVVEETVPETDSILPSFLLDLEDSSSSENQNNDEGLSQDDFNQDNEY